MFPAPRAKKGTSLSKHKLAHPRAAIVILYTGILAWQGNQIKAGGNRECYEYFSKMKLGYQELFETLF